MSGTNPARGRFSNTAHRITVTGQARAETRRAMNVRVFNCLPFGPRGPRLTIYRISRCRTPVQVYRGAAGAAYTLAESSLPQRMSRIPFDAGEILHPEGDAMQGKPIRV